MSALDYIATPEARRRWLPRVGPTTYLMAVLVDEPGGGDLSVEEMATLLGVAPSVARRSLDRGIQFHLITAHNGRWVATPTTTTEAAT